MADIAAFTDVDIAPGQFERAVGPHAVDILDGVFEVEQGRDFHDAANGYRQKREDEEQRGAFFKQLVA